MPADPGRPTLHVRPAQGWLNDPNGICRIDGTWHVFFQYRPDLPLHGDIGWGHVSSTDLVRWTAHPLALSPRPDGPDARGCWSGCVVDDDGVPTAVYTALRDHPAGAAVVLARSDRRLVDWTQGELPVVGPPWAAGMTQARDPFVFHHGGRRFAVQGAGRVGGPPGLLLHECADLTEWQERGLLLSSEDRIAAEVAPAEIWECPNLVPLGERWLLVLSLWRHEDGVDVLAGSRWLTGDLVEAGEGLRFVPVAGGVFDDGDAWYAPHLVRDGDRLLAWGWARETVRTAEEVLASGWSGVLTLPREVLLRGDRVVMTPADERLALRAGRLDVVPTDPVASAAFELVARGPALLRSGGPDGPAVARVVGGPEEPARILVDGDTVEVFTATGSATRRVRIGPGHRWHVDADAATTELHRLAVPVPAGG